MAVLIEIFIVLAVIGLAFQHKYLVAILAILYLFSAPTIIFIFAIILYFLYQNPQVRGWIDLKIQNYKLHQEARKNRQQYIQNEIDNFKSASSNQIYQKYNCDIKFNKMHIEYDALTHHTDEIANKIKSTISELEELIKFYNKEKR